MLTKAEKIRSLNSCWTMLSIVAFLVLAPMAAGSSANAASFSFTPIDVPDATFTDARGINDAGQIVGYFEDSTGFHGFLDTGGSFTQIDVLGAGLTAAHGINDAGQIVGNFPDSTAPFHHGFLNTGGSVTPIDVPGAIHLPRHEGGTVANGINDGGQIVGNFLDSTFAFHGFLNTGGSFTPIDAPGAIFGTQAFGINDAGQIVGNFLDSTFAFHGFLATPIAAPVPEPSTLTLLSVGIGLTVLCVMRRREEPIIPKQ